MRMLRLSWQPLWWDEGYSLFFATEPIAEMLRLTALDIHPPLYYILLHLWFDLIGDTGPETARLLSVLIGVVTLPVLTWVTFTFWPRRAGLALLATFLLAVNPIHVFYSQEVRMYALALLLTLLATAAYWRIMQGISLNRQPYLSTVCYIVTASLALLTLYYAGFVLLAHQLWAILANRPRGRSVRWSLGAAFVILLMQVPWWQYALPKLFAYVEDKVLADQDVALTLWSYLWQHWLAFFTGHVVAPLPLLESIRLTSAALLALVLVVGMGVARRNIMPYPLRFIVTLCVVPVSTGYVVNVIYPFFPEGGERLLLHVLPYLVLGVAYAGVTWWGQQRALAGSTLALTCVAAGIGLWIYFTTPRYADHDYRPIVMHVLQHSRATDTVLALFPWQVGYWRAYTPRTAQGELLSPQPAPVDQGALVWDEQLAMALDAALSQSTVWFPMPVSFGSTLPREIEAYLAARARNLENTWFSPATRLTAWVSLPAPGLSPLSLSFPDDVSLVGAGVGASPVASANEPLALDLCWQPYVPRENLRVTLRLVDASDFTWASRDLTPLAAYAGDHPGDACREALAFAIPAGLPPARYRLMLGVGPVQSDRLLTPIGATASLTPLAEVDVTAPTSTLSPARLAIEHPQAAVVNVDGLQLLGHRGPGDDAGLLAGDEVALTIFMQSTTGTPPARALYVSLLNQQGEGVAGWQGWPLPHHSTDTWQAGTLAQVPLHFYLPADLDATRYTLAAGFLDSTTAWRSEPVALAQVRVERRPATFDRPAGIVELSPVPTLGTHAELIGYTMRTDASMLQLDLTWHVLQPLLPPHHLFVHVVDNHGEPVTQVDGEPSSRDGRAPTGSWLPGEYLTTHLELPLAVPFDPSYSLRIGLYLPKTGARLPVTVGGTQVGDYVDIPYQVDP